MSSKTAAYQALTYLRYEVDERIVDDVTEKVNRALGDLQNEVDEWRARALASEMREGLLKNELAVSPKGTRREAVLHEALQEGKVALDTLIAIQYPEECGYFAVMEAHNRIKDQGTIGYVADVLLKIRSAQNAHKPT